MSDFFSSALNYFTGGSDGGASSRFVGQVVDLGGGNKLKVKKVIAEGGYGYVFIAQDVRTGKDYALKRQVVPKENVKIIKQEIAFLRQLGNHPHIVNYVASAGCPPSQTPHGNAEFLIQTELCNGGRMEDVVRSLRLTPRQVLRVFFETCSAVAHMHSQKPPIIHRDLKVENLLLNSRGAIKLCDFGSATIQQLHPDHSWTAVQRGLAEDEIQRNTTPMYRSPEMIDLYSNSPVNEKADIWALGCLLYMLCYQEHPFEDSAKLRILNANYRIPPEDTTFTAFHNIIRACLVVDPSSRPSVDSIMAQLYSIADQLGENLDQPPSEPLLAAAAQSDAETSTDSSSSGVSSALQSTSHQAQRLFGFMKDGAGNLFKNIRESSSKVIHSMSGSGTKNSALDITYITSRILAMSFPHDDSSHVNNIDEVSAFLNEKHPSQYLVFNLSGQDYDISKLDNQVADFEWPHKHMPNLEKLVDLCRNLDSWLRADTQNIIVVHCHDGRSITSVVVAAYLIFLGAFLSPTVPLKLFSLKRSPELPLITGTPGQLRYLQYIADLVGPKGYKPHTHPASLCMLRMTTVPRFNAIKTGCKPFVEVFQNSERLYTSASQDNMEQIKSFAASEDRVVEIPLNVMVNGNVIVVVHHIRAIPANKMSGMGMTAIRMFQFQLHTGFISPDTTTVTLERSDLDGSSVNKEDKLPSPFQVILELEFDRSEGVRDERSAISWQNLPHPRASPLTCFTSHTEEQEVLQMFAESDRNAAVDQQQKLPEISTATADLVGPSASLLDEESTSAGGNLLNLHLEETTTHGSGSSHDFYSQLDWQEGGEAVGYVPYEDKDESSSSSSGSSGSSSGSEEELRQRGADPFSAAKSSVMANPTSEHFANFEAAFGTQNASAFRPVRPQVQQKEEEEKLIEFSFTEDVQTTNQTPQVISQQPQQKVGGGRALNGIFGENFDPWKGTTQVPPGQQKGGAGVTSLLNLEESDDEQSSVSMQSELRAVGTESFGHVLKSSQPTRPTQLTQPKQIQSSKSALGLNDFDPFGPTSSSGGGGNFLELLAPTLTPLHPSTSAPNLSTQAQQPRQLDLNILHPSKGSSQGSKWTQNKPTFGKPNYTPGLSTIGGSQSDLSDATSSQWGGRGGGYPRGRSGYPGSETTSPYSTSPRTSPIPFGAHSISTGNLTHGFHGGNIQTQPQTSKPDPFAEFGNIKQLSGARTTAASSNPAKTVKSAPPPMTSRPAYQMYRQQQPVSQPQPLRSQSPRPFQPPRSHSPRPAFGSVFGDSDRGGGGSWTRMGVPPSVADKQFGDLLQGHNFSGGKDKEPRSLKEMKAKSNIEQALDPDRARVVAWAEGKERNIRALLNSLHEILWEGEARWTKVEMHQLLQPEQVKKIYRKACLSVHPDKTQGTNHENLARAIFDELNDAYTRFEETGAKPLFL